MGKILVVDDESSIILIIKALLTRAGHEVSTADNGNLAAELLAKKQFDLFICDMQLPGVDGLTLVKKAKELQPHIQTIVMTAYSNVDNALEAMKSGVSDYLVKPFNFNELVANIGRRLSHTSLSGVTSAFLRRSALKFHYDMLIGESKAMFNVYMAIEKYTANFANLLIYGSRGTGKELCAKTIHLASPASNVGAFVSVDCAALAPHKAANELFGVFEHGAMRNGLFVTADGGTLYMRNIEALPSDVQHKVSEYLNTRVIWPSNADTPVSLELRIIASTCCKSPEDLLETGMDPELCSKLLVEEPMRMPDLKERDFDITLLTMKMLNDFEIEMRRHIEITESALEKLRTIDWSEGQIDRLFEMLKIAVSYCDGDCVTEECIINAEQCKFAGATTEFASYSVYHKNMQYTRPPFSIESIPGQMSLKQRLRCVESQYIRRVIADCGGDKEIAAEKLGISLATLYRKLEEKDVEEK